MAQRFMWQMHRSDSFHTIQPTIHINLIRIRLKTKTKRFDCKLRGSNCKLGGEEVLFVLFLGMELVKRLSVRLRRLLPALLSRSGERSGPPQSQGVVLPRLLLGGGGCRLYLGVRGRVAVVGPRELPLAAGRHQEGHEGVQAAEVARVKRIRNRVCVEIDPINKKKKAELKRSKAKIGIV